MPCAECVRLEAELVAEKRRNDQLAAAMSQAVRLADALEATAERIAELEAGLKDFEVIPGRRNEMAESSLTEYPERWRPVLSAMLEVLDEYAPGGFALKSVERVNDKVEIRLTVPWVSTGITFAHRVAERALTKIPEETV